MNEVIRYDSDRDGRFTLKYEGQLYEGGSTVYVKNSF